MKSLSSFNYLPTKENDIYFDKKKKVNKQDIEYDYSTWCGFIIRKTREKTNSENLWFCPWFEINSS